MGAYDDLPGTGTAVGAYDDLPDVDELPEVVATKEEGGNGLVAKINAWLGGKEGVSERPSQLATDVREAAPEGTPFVHGFGETASHVVPQSWGEVGGLAESFFPPIEAYRQAKAGFDITRGTPAHEAMPDIGLLKDVEDIAQEFGADSPEYQAAAGKAAGTLLPQLIMAGILGKSLKVPPKSYVRDTPLVPEPPPTQGIGPGTIAGDVQRALDRRFTMQEPPPEAPPQLAPAPPIEETLPNLPSEPPVFNPELGPQTIPEFQMPLRTETAMTPGAAKQLGKLKAYVEKAKKLGQNVDPKVTAKIAEIEGVPQEAASTKPDWVNQQIDAMSAPLEANGVANQIEALAAQRLTAKQIAQKLGLEPEQVSAVRAKRGIPSMEDRPGFEAWIKSRQPPEAPGGIPVAAAEPPPPGAGAPEIPPEPYTPEAAAARAAQPAPPPVQTEVPGTVGISEARTEAELGPGSVVPGAGAEMGSGLAYGREYVNKGGDPRLPIRRANTSGMVGKNDVGIVHAELDRLRVERNKAAAALEANPTDPVLQQAFSVADDAQRAWRKELQPVLTKASDALREAHAASVPDADVGTYQGLADLMDEHFKGERTLSPEERTALAKAAKGVKESRNIANGEMAKVEDTLTKQVRARGKKVMSPEELDADLKGELETIFKDCILGA